MNRAVPALKTGELRRNRAAQVAAVALIGLSLAACKTIETPDTIPYSYDAAERHPITVHEGVRTVELLIGMHLRPDPARAHRSLRVRDELAARTRRAEF